eukprot:2599540-Pyramimonas_sp.AAC.1
MGRKARIFGSCSRIGPLLGPSWALLGARIGRLLGRLGLLLGRLGLLLRASGDVLQRCASLSVGT